MMKSSEKLGCNELLKRIKTLDITKDFTKLDEIKARISSKEKNILFSSEPTPAETVSFFKVGSDPWYNQNQKQQESKFTGQNSNFRNYGGVKKEGENSKPSSQQNIVNVKENAFSMLGAENKRKDSFPETFDPQTFNILSCIRNTAKPFQNLDLDNLCLLSGFLGFGNYNPFLYIYSPIGKHSIGPYSFNDLKSFYNMKYIDGSSKVRLIDTYKIKGKAPFEFLPLSQFAVGEEFYDQIEPNNWLIQLASSLKTKQENHKQKEEEIKKLKALEVMASKESDKRFIKNDATKDDKSIKASQEIQSSTTKEKFDDTKTQQDANVKSLVVKKKKKAVELDIKTGFYSMTEQEKKYTQHYTAN